MWQLEPWHVRWGRRAVTIPGLFVVSALFLALLPLLLLHAVVWDRWRGRPLVLARFHLTMTTAIVGHLIGFGGLMLWSIVGAVLRLRGDRWHHLHRALEGWWSNLMLETAARCWGARFEVEGAELIAPGPVMVLSRHVSTLDTILPLKVAARKPLGMIMRLVMKRELIWDPCIDIVTHRLPRTFVQRGSTQIADELGRLVHLCDGMDGDDAIVIFPEGTRGSPTKRASILRKLEERDPAAAAVARRLRHLLPIRPMGTLAMLDARADLDVVFMAHTGLEGANRLEDLIAGSLLDQTIRVKFWRASRADVPTEREARIAWLNAWWERVDAWVDAHGDRRGWAERRAAKRAAA
jgi:1-acyl-sn-glycerol-3-phosphate acyltransferase